MSTESIQGDETLQLLRENNMLVDGQHRYKTREENIGQMSLRSSPHKILQNALSKVTEHIDAVIAEKDRDSYIGRRNSWLDDIKPIDSELLAYLGLSTCMDAVGTNETMTWALVKIGKRIEMEHWALGLAQHDKALHKRITEKVTKDHSSERYRTKAAKAIASKAGYKAEPWTDERRTKAASPIFNCILESSDVFEVWSFIANNKTTRKMGLTPEASAAIAELDGNEAWAHPVLAPMIVEPTMWTHFHTGCYLDDSVSSIVDLIRFATPQQKAYCYSKSDISQEPWVSALNHIQATPFVINERVLEAIKWLWDEDDKSVPKFPRKQHLDRPDSPEEWDNLSIEEKKGYRIQAREVITKNREIDGNRAVMYQDIKTAESLVEFDQFYLPMNFDTRGRIYPVPHFSFHRDSHVKAMFLFKNKKPMGEGGGYWLSVHLANAGDFNKISKQSFDDRVQWVVDNEDKILAVAADFRTTFDYWGAADKPFEFLAACIEYAYFTLDGDAYECGLPISLDGSNSGVQHFSALALNKDDAGLVNLVPGDKPADIYQTVANKVLEKLKQDDDPKAKLWLDYGVTRKTVKRNVMTYGYSSKKFGFQQQIVEDLMKPLEDDVLLGVIKEHPFGDHGYDCARYLAKINWDAITEVISSAKEGMAFLQQLCGSLAHEGKHMSWVTPVGFPAGQFYPEQVSKKLKIFLFDREMKSMRRSQVTLSANKETRVDKRKSKTAISPNVIHSLDSSHLMSTVLLGLEKGIFDWFLIHDSFATTPGQTDILYRVVREAFCNQYGDDKNVYEELKQQVERQLEKPKGLPDIPARGDLNIKQIRNSKYCFS